MPITLNATTELEHTVTLTDLATHWKNNLDVLATPILLWHAELTCMKVIADGIPAGMISVGVSHNMIHLAPTPLNFRIKICATLIDKKGNKLIFKVTATDTVDIILKGEHTRILVEQKIFKQRVTDKASNIL